MSKFLKYSGMFKNLGQKKVRKLSLKIKIYNAKGTFNFTDIMLQYGENATGYIINTKEMIERANDKTKHYNILVRGKNNGIIVNNDGEASTGLDFTIVNKNGITGDTKIETLYKTRKLIIKGSIGANKDINIDSFSYAINTDNKSIEHKGTFLGLPSGFGLYNIDMNNRDIGNFVFKVIEFNKKDKL